MAGFGSFDEEDTGVADGAANMMARRQLRFSLIVALVLLAAAGMMAAGVRHETPVGMAARHAVLGAAAARAPVAQAALQTMTTIERETAAL
jgi:hypothetical protein